MTGKSTYLESALLNWLKGSTFPAAPATVYVGLFSSDPTDANTGGTEVTSTLRSAGRVGITTSSGFSAVSAAAISNSAAVDFGNAAGGAAVSHVAIFDAATNGNKLYSGALSASRTFITGDSVKFEIGAISFSEA